MAVGKILCLFAIVAATPFVYSGSYEYNMQPDALWNRTFRDGFDNLCDAEECRRMTDVFLHSMDQSVDPCENFYQFTCGNFASNSPILPSMLFPSQTVVHQKIGYLNLPEILGDEPHDTDIVPTRQAKKWYSECSDTDKLEKRGIEPLVSLVAQAGGWPIAEPEYAWNSVHNSWQEIEKNYARLTGHNAFYDILVGPPQKGSKFGDIAIVAPELLVARAKVLNSQRYYSFLEDAIKSFVRYNHYTGDTDENENSDGNTVSEEIYSREAEELVTFERKLLRIITKKKWKDLTRGFVRMPLHRFIEAYQRNPSGNAPIDWQSGIQHLFDPLKITIDPATIIYVNIGAIKALNALLSKTSSKTIVNYVHWNYIITMAPYTNEEIRKSIFDMGTDQRSYGLKKLPRWVECVDEVAWEMPYVVANEYTKKYYPITKQWKVHLTIGDVQYELEANIDRSNWLDESSKLLAKDKIRTAMKLDDVPKWYNDATAVTDYYEGLDIVESMQYFEIVLSNMRFKKSEELKIYAMSVDEAAQQPRSTDEASRYNEGANALNRAFLLGSLITPQVPRQFIYASAALMTGINMGYEFATKDVHKGDSGSQFSTNIMTSYYQRARCFDESTTFDNMDSEPEAENGTKDIVDTTGFQAVFEAYKAHREPELFDEPFLLGPENVTEAQLFFIAFGGVSAEKTDLLRQHEACCPNMTRYACGLDAPVSDTDDWNTENNWRNPRSLLVNGAVSASDDFAKAFNCPLGSAMNPTNKCKIWKDSSVTPEVVFEEIPLQRISKHRYIPRGKWIN